MYTPLYVKSNYSFLKSLVKIDDLVKKCNEYNINMLAITDLNMISTMHFYKSCKANNIKPIIGLSTTFEDKDICIYAKNHEGYELLIKANLNKRINLRDIEDNKENIIIVIPYQSRELFNILKYSNTYIGFSNKKEQDELESITNRLVLFNEILYVTKKESKYFKYAMMLEQKKNVLDDIKYEDHNNYLLNANELKDIKKEYIENSNKIGNECKLDIENHENLIPVFENNKNVDSDEYLKQLSIKGLSIRLDGKIPNTYKERLMYELDVIKNMGYSDYFLIVYDFVKYAKKNKILVGPGRGSAGGSLVAYSLGIIDFDPLFYNLLFERFLNPDRVTMPDIDVDLPDEYRDEVKDYVREKYGEKFVAGVIAVGTLKSRAVLDDVGKILNIEQEKVDRLKRFFVKPKDKYKLKEMYDESQDFRNIINNNERLKLLFDVSLYFEEFPKNSSIHASGVIISKKELEKIIPVVYEDNKLISSFEGGYLEDLGLLKMDFLGNANLTIVMNTLKLIKDKEGIDIDYLNIPLDDKDTLKCFYDVDTNGIFQFESDVMKNLLSKFKVETFDDIVAAISLVRPGPDTNTYIERKTKHIKVDYKSKEIENVLGSTLGVLVYQEQVMEIARVVAGFTRSEADNLRRAMSKKKKTLIESYKEEFISGGIKNGYDKDYLNKLYEEISAFSEYGFNKSHAVAYAVFAYKMAYLKVHYPYYFYINLLSMCIGDEKKTNTMIKEAKKRGLIFLLPDINSSSTVYEIESNAIRFPLSNIKDIGLSKAQAIINARGEGFKDIYDAIVKLNSASIGRKTLETLIYAGCFDSFGYNKNTLISNLDNLLTYAYIADGIENDIIEHPSIEEKEEFDKKDLMEKEKSLFGFYLTHHPTSLYKDKYKVINLIDVKDYFSRVIDTLILVEKVKVHKDKKGNDMAFITGSDESADCEYIFFSNSFSEISEVKRGDILIVRGRVEKRSNYQIVVEKSKII